MGFGDFRDFFAERCTGFFCGEVYGIFQSNLPLDVYPYTRSFFAKDFASSDYPNENEFLLSRFSRTVSFVFERLDPPFQWRLKQIIHLRVEASATVIKTVNLCE